MVGMMLLSVLLLFAAIPKWVGRADFLVTLKRLGISGKLASLVIWILPLAEVVVGIGIWFEELRMLSLIGLFMLTASFLWAIVRGKSKKLKCNCFGSMIDEQFGWKTAVRVILMIAIGLFVLYKKSIIPNTSDMELTDLLWSFILSVNLFGSYVLANSLAAYRKHV